jgi:hypothetical protein
MVAIAAHFAFGGGLFYGVQKFFEEIEKKLSVGTKDDIALWLLDLHPSGKFRDWRPTFAKIFNQVFGEKQLSWKCFWRSTLTSTVTSVAVIVGAWLLVPSVKESPPLSLLVFAILAPLGNSLPDYLSLWKTRYLISLSQKSEHVFRGFLLFVADVIISIPIAYGASAIGALTLILLAYRIDPRGTKGKLIKDFISMQRSLVSGDLAMPLVLWFVPAFFGRLWLLTYVVSGLLLKTARRFDIGFAWFNKKFDVGNHPLQCIGLVARDTLRIGLLDTCRNSFGTIAIA